MVSPSESLCLCLSTSLPPPPSLFLSLCPSLFICFCLSLSFCLCLHLSVSVFLSVCLSLSLCLSVSFPLSLKSPFRLPTFPGPRSPASVCEQGPGSALCGWRRCPDHLHHRRCPISSDQVGQVAWGWGSRGCVGLPWGCPACLRGAGGQPVSWVRASYSQDRRLSAEEWV